MGTNWPNSPDTDLTLPSVFDNISELGSEALDSQKDAILAIETNLGIGLAGTTQDLATRLSQSLNPDGTIKPSAIASLGLITLPITNSQVSATAGILESKLTLDHRTADLYNSIQASQTSIQTALAYISDTGFKLEPHLEGITYRHLMADIDVAASSPSYFKNHFGLLRDNSNLYNLFADFNTDLITHQLADSTGTGTIPPANYAHVAAGIYLNPSTFSFVPQTIISLQAFADFIDSSNIFLLGTRIQTLYANGIPNTAQSGTLPNPSMGQLLVPTTTVQTYLLHGGSSAPVDSIDDGDDLVEFFPPAAQITNNTFDASFSLIRIGDIITVNYTGFSVQSIIKEKKLINTGGKRYVVRIDARNSADGYFTAQVNRSLFNTNKSGVLALAQANAPTNVLPSLVCGHPRGAQALGLNFNEDQIDAQHFNLYLQLYPTGNPLNQVVNLPAIDITGNKGTTPGLYTIDSIVESTNASLRKAGFNYRFMAYSYQGEFGIMLAEPYNNASFSIIAGVLNSSGLYDQGSNTSYPSNVIGVPGSDSKDALGFGPSNSNLASPPFSASYATAAIAQTPTRLIIPLTRNNYYVNGIERERFDLESNQVVDGYGDGYWPATIVNKLVIPGVRVEVTYQVNLDLSKSHIQVGKTLVVQAASVIDSGRFFIKGISFNNCSLPSAFTQITVYDAIHSTGVTPFASANIGTPVSLYFTSDSIGFNIENSSDFATAGISFKRHFEIYVDDDGYTFSHERGRLGISGTNTTINGITLFGNSNLSHINLYKISPKLRGYQFSSVTKINLQLTSYSSITGIFSGYLCQWDGSTVTNQGPVTVGKKGNVVRFYDQTNVDYIDLIFDAADTITSFSTTQNIDIQLFPTLSLDGDIMLLGTVQVNDATNQLKYLRDERQFGNVSENQLTTSALDYIAKPTQLLQENGIIRGFDIISISGNNLTLEGGVAVVNGKIIQLDNEVVGIPIVQETLVPYGQSITFNTITWFVCINDKAEIEFIASTDFDPTTSSSTYNLAGVDHTRIFYAINPNTTSTPYQITGTYLSDLVANYKTLTPIAVIISTIGLVSGNYVVSSTINHDARRFIYNGYGGLSDPFIFGANASFRSLDALNTWLTQLLNFKSSLTYNNTIGQKVIVKGPTTLTAATTLNYNSEVIFEGDGGSFTISTISTGFNLGSNISFKNLIFNNAYDPIANSDPNYTDGYLTNNANAFLYCNVNTVSGNQNIKIENCTFNSTLQKRYPFIVFNFSASGAICENVKISNNKFNTTYAADDKLAVISFIGPSVASTASLGPRLINCSISHNYCNKNQLIQISSPLVNDVIEDLIVGVNVEIDYNTCGAINILTKRDTSLTTYNTSLIRDKGTSVSVYGNNCKFIYCGLGNGSAIDGNGNRVFVGGLLANGIFTGNLTIENNTLSFMYAGQRTSSTYSPTNLDLIIRDNRFKATDMSTPTGYLNDYYVGFIGFPYTTTALIIEKAVGS